MILSLRKRLINSCATLSPMPEVSEITATDDANHEPSEVLARTMPDVSETVGTTVERKRPMIDTFREFGIYIGPGFIISVAYMDPGNWATNISGGASYGTALLWVIVLASLMAMGIQIVAVKLGIATGKDVAQLCRESFPKPVVYLLWVAAEIAMICTDMAEIIGAAIGFQLLCNFPLWAGAILAVASSFALLGVRSAFTQGYRVVEVIIMAFVGIIALAFVIELFVAKPSAQSIAAGLIPSIPDADALFIGIGILGATIMPHSVYLHPYIVQDRRALLVEEKGDTDLVHRRHLRFESADTVMALSGAMFVNAAMLIVAAAALAGTGIDTLEQAYVTLSDVFDGYASIIFGIALISAGLSSSLVATLAGQIVMDGFLNWGVNVWIRRSITVVPSLAVVLSGLEPTKVLVASQVALSFELPFVLVPLLYFTRNEDLMGNFVNRRSVNVVMCFIVTVIIGLNIWLLVSVALGL
jgi:manganese transport protein